MNKIKTSWLILSFLAFAGCDAAVEPEQPQNPAKTSEVSLAALLAKPRAELAQLCDEWTTNVRYLENEHRDGNLPFTLLPKLHLPRAIPVWRQARFNATTALSLPPYLTDGRKDNEAALHLARYGDIEAARQLADLGSADVLKQIEALTYEQNYPVEWTRLVTLMLHSAQLRLATDDRDALHEIIAIHRQLQTVLDTKAARVPLGTALLPQGRISLSQAAQALRDAGDTELAEQTQSELTTWGDVRPLCCPWRQETPCATCDPSAGRQ